MMSTKQEIADSIISEKRERAEAEQIDSGILYLAVMSLAAVIVILIVIFVIQNGISGAVSIATQTVSTGVGRIELILAPAFSEARLTLTHVQGVAERALGDATDAVSQGVQSALNTIGSVGKSVLDTVVNGFQTLTEFLADVGNQLVQIFVALFEPVQTAITFGFDLLLQFLQFVASTIQPIIALVQSIIDAVSIITNAIND
jgi:hypothetical protein